MMVHRADGGTGNGDSLVRGLGMIENVGFGHPRLAKFGGNPCQQIEMQNLCAQGDPRCHRDARPWVAGALREHK